MGSRVKYTAYNFITSIGGIILTIVMNFIVRTVFVKTLGKAYLGIDGLFSNVLSMLSLADLGLGTAVIYKLYEPVAKGDEKRIRVLMGFYKSAYRVIGIVIALLGLALIPFLPYLINDYDKLEGLNLSVPIVFILFLSRSVSSYLFTAYKSAIIGAHQKEYIINIIIYVFTILAGLAQVIFLCVYPNFLVYVLISVLQIILQNFACAYIANKKYPYIKKKEPEKLPKDEIKEIIKDCGALFIYSANSFVLKATDNIVLSTFIGIEIVGLYSNYYILYLAMNKLMSKLYDSLRHSLGNLHTEHNLKHEYEVFEAISLITAVLGSVVAIGLTCVSNEFVKVWIGSDWVISQPFALLLGLEMYTLAINKQMNRFRTTMGLFQQAKFRPVASMVINIVLSIILVKICGIHGVIIATIVANWTTMIWYDPYIIHKLGFKNEYPVSRYFLKLTKYTLIAVIIGIIDYLFCCYVFTGYGWFSVIVHSAVCGITVLAVFVITQRNKPEGKYLINIIKKILINTKKA